MREGRRALYAVGSSAFLNDPPRQQGLADNLAIADLTRLVGVFSATLMTEFGAFAATKVRLNEEQSLGMTLNVLTSQTLPGVFIAERYVDQDGATFSLALLDYGYFELAVRRPELSNTMRSFAANNLNRIYLELDANARKTANGVCVRRLRLRRIERSAKACTLPSPSTVVELLAPCSGGTAAVSALGMKGSVDAAGTIAVSTEPVARHARGCVYTKTEHIQGMLDGEMVLFSEEIADKPDCTEACRLRAKVVRSK